MILELDQPIQNGWVLCYFKGIREIKGGYMAVFTPVMQRSENGNYADTISMFMNDKGRVKVSPRKAKALLRALKQEGFGDGKVELPSLEEMKVETVNKKWRGPLEVKVKNSGGYLNAEKLRPSSKNTSSQIQEDKPASPFSEDTGKVNEFGGVDDFEPPKEEKQEAAG
jgi:hypothetical protein